MNTDWCVMEMTWALTRRHLSAHRGCVKRLLASGRWWLPHAALEPVHTFPSRLHADTELVLTLAEAAPNLSTMVAICCDRSSFLAECMYHVTVWHSYCLLHLLTGPSQSEIVVRSWYEWQRREGLLSRRTQTPFAPRSCARSAVYPLLWRLRSRAPITYTHCIYKYDCCCDTIYNRMMIMKIVISSFLQSHFPPQQMTPDHPLPSNQTTSSCYSPLNVHLWQKIYIECVNTISPRVNPHFCPIARTKLRAPTVNVVPIPMMVDPERQSSSTGTDASLQREQDMTVTIGPHRGSWGLTLCISLLSSSSLGICWLWAERPISPHNVLTHCSPERTLSQPLI